MVSPCAGEMWGVEVGGAFDSDKQIRKGVSLKGELGSVFVLENNRHLD